MFCVLCNLDIFQGVQPQTSVTLEQLARQPLCNMPLLSSCALCQLLVLEPKYLCIIPLMVFYIVIYLRYGEGRLLYPKFSHLVPLT